MIVLFYCSVSGGAWEDGRAGEQEVVVVLRKDQLDKANKDTHHKLLPEDFQVSCKVFTFQSFMCH